MEGEKCEENVVRMEESSLVGVANGEVVEQQQHSQVTEETRELSAAPPAVEKDEKEEIEEEQKVEEEEDNKKEASSSSSSSSDEEEKKSIAEVEEEEEADDLPPPPQEDFPLPPAEMISSVEDLPPPVFDLPSPAEELLPPPEITAEETKVNGTNGHSAAEDDLDGEDDKEDAKVNGHDESKESGSSVKSYVSLVSPTGFVPPSSFADAGNEGDECG